MTLFALSACSRASRNASRASLRLVISLAPDLAGAGELDAADAGCLKFLFVCQIGAELDQLDAFQLLVQKVAGLFFGHPMAPLLSCCIIASTC